MFIVSMLWCLAHPTIIGLPLWRCSRKVPNIISFSRLQHFLIRPICPKYDSFLFLTFSNKLLLISAFSSTQSFVLFTVHDTRNSLLNQTSYLHVSFFHLLSFLSSFHLHTRPSQVSRSSKENFSTSLMPWLLQIFFMAATTHFPSLILH